MKNSFGLLLFGLLGLGVFLVLTRSKGAGVQSNYSTRPVSLKLKPAARRYQNAETWDITWNADGLPSKVTIHRDATQS